MSEQAENQDSPSVELSVVIPCLNEADTLATCIEKAQKAMRSSEIVGEIIVSDNGSSDDSVAIASRMGVRVVEAKEKGYGNALMVGIEAAQGKYVIMGDADDSYDFLTIPQFLDKLREGYDLVQGCRLPSGGGKILAGAMPFTHRWLGNPLFSTLARWWFRAPIHDINCGLRGFSKKHYERLNLRCTGMEFAVEMIIKSALFNSKFAEVPVTLSPDGRIAHRPHLRTFQDGWRTLRFYLLYCPQWLFLVPGILLVLIGLLGYIIALPRLSIGAVTFDVHTLLFASLSIICGYQAVVFGLFAKTFAVGEGLLPQDPWLDRFFRVINLERGLLIGFASLTIGTIFWITALLAWKLVGFGPLDYERIMRWVIPGAMLTVLGFQTILSSFLLSVLRITRR